MSARRHRPDPRTIAVTVAWTAGVALTLVGIVLWGPGVLLLTVVAAAVVWWRKSRKAEQPPASSEPDELVRLTGAQLALAWQVSYVLLKQARDSQSLQQVVELRRRQLDEIERRDPCGYRRWVSSGNWVRGDSVPFLRG